MGYRLHNSNPCRNTRRCRMSRKEPHLLAEETAGLKFWCPHVVAIVRLLVFTGCRFGEMVSLEWGWIKGQRIHLSDRKFTMTSSILGRPRVS